MYDAFAWAYAQMAAGGITSLFDAWVEPWQLDFYAALAENGHLPQRVFPALMVPTKAVYDPEAVLAKVTRLAAKYAGVTNLQLRRSQGLHGRRHRVPRPDGRPARALHRRGRQPH